METKPICWCFSSRWDWTFSSPSISDAVPCSFQSWLGQRVGVFLYKISSTKWYSYKCLSHHAGDVLFSASTLSPAIMVQWKILDPEMKGNYPIFRCTSGAFKCFLFSPRSLGSFDPIWLAHIFQLGWFNHQLDATVEPRIGGRQFQSPRSTCHPFRETSTSPKSTLEASGTWPSGVYIVSWRTLLDVIAFWGVSCRGCIEENTVSHFECDKPSSAVITHQPLLMFDMKGF